MEHVTIKLLIPKRNISRLRRWMSVIKKRLSAQYKITVQRDGKQVVIKSKDYISTASTES